MQFSSPAHTATSCLILALFSSPHALATDFGFNIPHYGYEIPPVEVPDVEVPNFDVPIPSVGCGVPGAFFDSAGGLCRVSVGNGFESMNEFAFGFTVNPFYDVPTLPGNCGIPGGFGSAGSLCSIGNGTETPDPDTTPFYQGQILINGITYWHIIVGDPESGFAMESYTQMELTKTGGFGSFSGGEPTNNSGLDFFSPFLASGGIGNGTLQSLEVISGNGWNPLSNDVDFTGNGTGDPTRTVVRQIMGDGTWDAQNRTWSCGSGEFCSEFLKDRLDYKPVINQAINSIDKGVLTQLQFELDMSNSTYTDMNTAGAITNTLTMVDLYPTDDSFDIRIANFDMATDTQQERSSFNGGRYVYNDCLNQDPTEGSCWQSFSVSGGINDYDEGSYTYVSGSNDPMGYDWEVYFDAKQNELPGSGNKAKCDTDSAPNSCASGSGSSQASTASSTASDDLSGYDWDSLLDLDQNQLQELYDGRNIF